MPASRRTPTSLGSRNRVTQRRRCQVHRNQAVLLTLVAVTISIVALSPLFGQAVGTILGTITDSSGAVAPNTAVTITNLQTGQVRIARSNSVGNYIAPALPPGRYTVEAEMQ